MLDLMPMQWYIIHGILPRSSEVCVCQIHSANQAVRATHDSFDCGHFLDNYDTCPVGQYLHINISVHDKSDIACVLKICSTRAHNNREPNARDEQKVHTIIVSLIWKSILLLLLLLMWMLPLLLASSSTQITQQPAQRSLSASVVKSQRICLCEITYVDMWLFVCPTTVHLYECDNNLNIHVLPSIRASVRIFHRLIDRKTYSYDRFASSTSRCVCVFVLVCLCVRAFIRT